MITEAQLFCTVKHTIHSILHLHNLLSGPSSANTYFWCVVPEAVKQAPQTRCIVLQVSDGYISPVLQNMRDSYFKTFLQCCRVLCTPKLLPFLLSVFRNTEQ